MPEFLVVEKDEAQHGLQGRAAKIVHAYLSIGRRWFWGVGIAAQGNSNRAQVGLRQLRRRGKPGLSCLRASTP